MKHSSVLMIDVPSYRLLPLLLLIFLLPLFCLSQEVNGRFSTSIYSWEQYTSVSTSKVIARAFQTAQIDVAQGDVSFHTSMTGAMRVNGELGEDATIRMRQLFVEWNRGGDLLRMRAGRVPVFAGVGLGIVDGVSIQSTIADRAINVQAYGGENVRPDLKSRGFGDLDKNFLFGGQITGNVADGLRLGMSYVHRNIQRDSYTALRADSLFNPITITVVPDSKAEHVLGADLHYASGAFLSVYGRYDYDLYLKRSLRGQLHTRVGLTTNVAATAEFIYREPRIYYNSFFTVFAASPSREYEGGIEYEPLRALHAYAKFAYVQFSDDRSRRLTAGASWEYASVSYSGANGYAGDLASFDVQGTYPLLDRKVVPMVGVSVGRFRPHESPSARQDLFAASMGAVVRPAPQFSVDAQIQLLRNPVAANDVRFFAKVNYWFHADLNIIADAR